MIKIKDEIFAHMHELSPAEKKVARTLLADYPSGGLASAAALSKAAGTSTPTVLRLVSRLGIHNFAQFQQHLRDEISHQMNSPLSRATHSLDRTETSALQTSIAQRVAIADRLSSTVPPTEFDAAVELLGSSARNVVISGGYFSRHIAHILSLQLNQIRSGVDYADEPLGKDISKYFDLRKDSVVVIFDLRRHEQTAAQIASLAKKQGASVIVVTDEDPSPSSEYADVVLPVALGGVPFDSFAGVLVLVECLVEGVFTLRGTHALKRMSRWEETVQINRVFRLGDSADIAGGDHE